jgi:hypothetical protein
MPLFNTTIPAVLFLEGPEGKRYSAIRLRREPRVALTVRQLERARKLTGSGEGDLALGVWQCYRSCLPIHGGCPVLDRNGNVFRYIRIKIWEGTI